MRPRGKISAQELDDAEVVPVAVDRGIEFAAAREVGERLIEFTHRQISMPAPSQEQRVVRLDLEPAREGRDGLAKLRAPDCATPKSMICAMFFGSASSAAAPS
jgi:hypothetical protein